MDIIEQHIDVENESESVISLLSNHCQMSVAELKQAINKGALWLTRGKHTQRLRRVKKPLKAQDVLHFYYNRQVLAQEVAPARLISDLKDYSVWYKPYGMLSQGSKWSDHCTISRWAQTHLKPERPVFIVHRLDKAATGLILLAHSKTAARALSAMFEQHALEKHYQIIVHGDHSTHDQPQVIAEPIDGKSARSTFSCLNYDRQHDLSLVDVKIDSGRKHQIRRHAASINLPVVADRLHGDLNRHYPDSLNLQLCAVSLSFACPLSGKKQNFKLPKEYRPQLAAAAKQLAE
ncbi:RluA family pseudouridine synthase [Thalassomonas actiniarum]|nr:RluA family pseudouridine synthase [Thalassomonas actiniarum]